MAGFHFVLTHQSYKVRYTAVKKKKRFGRVKEVSQDPIRGVTLHGPQAYGGDNVLTLLVEETFPLLKVVFYYFMSYLNQVVE